MEDRFSVPHEPIQDVLRDATRAATEEPMTESPYRAPKGALEQRPLGDNGPSVDVIALGTWAIGGTQWGPTDDQESLAAIRSWLDAGGTFIDTADTYGEGHSEELVGQALQGRRDEVFLATKVGVLGNDKAGWKMDLSRKHILEGCEDSLRRLGTDIIDLYQLHWPVKDVPIQESVEALNTLREQGKIRYAGISNFNTEQIQEAARHGSLISLQSQFSMLDRHLLDSEIPTAQGLGMGFLAYSPLGRGILTGKFRGEEPSFPDNDVRKRDGWYHGEGWQRNQRVLDGLEPIARKHGKTMAQLAINWALRQPGVTCALVGAKRPDQVNDNIGGQGWALDADDLSTIQNLLRDTGA